LVVWIKFFTEHKSLVTPHTYVQLNANTDSFVDFSQVYWEVRNFKKMISLKNLAP
jgi:hypothetical protein